MAKSESSRPWGRPSTSALLLAGLTLLSAIAAWRIAVPPAPPNLSLKSGEVFRAEIFVGCFFFGYIVLAVLIQTFRLGRPPKRLGFGLLSFESEEIEKTVEALSEGAEAFEALQTRLTAVENQLGLTPTEAEAGELSDHLDGFRLALDDLQRMVKDA